MDSLLVIGITVLIVILKLVFKPAAQADNTDATIPDFKALLNLPDDEEPPQVSTGEYLPPIPAAQPVQMVQTVQPVQSAQSAMPARPRPKQAPIRTPKAGTAATNRVVEAAPARAKRDTANSDAAALCETASSDAHEIAEHFDLRRAVIYSEILKPKFDE